jgi:integrase
MPKLTAISVEKVKATAKRQEISDDGCKGLFFVVQPTGHRSFAVRYRFEGKPRKLTLAAGSTLAEARAQATAALRDVERGIDPSAVKRVQTRGRKEVQAVAESNSVRAIVENYFKREGKMLRSLNWQRKVIERHVYPAIGDASINEVKRKHIVAMLDRVEDRSGAPMADMVLSVLRPIFQFHAHRDEDFTSPIIRGMSRIKRHEHRRERILDDDELRRVWTTAEQQGDVFGAYIMFLLLTAARRDEAREMIFDEVKNGVWLLPAARNKTKVDLARPLSAKALAIIESRPRIVDSEYVFTATGVAPYGSLSRDKRAFDIACGVRGWWFHDLRRTARSLMSRAGVPSDVAEMNLGHALPGIRQTYDRYSYSQEKLVAYEKLAALIERIVRPPQDNVVPLLAEA